MEYIDESKEFTNPVVVRFMTGMEHLLYPNWHGFSSFDTGIEEGEDRREIALRFAAEPRERASTFAHELGHVRYPVAVIGGDESTEEGIRGAFSELCADYYEAQHLSHNPLRIIEKIVSSKEELKSLGLTRKQVNRLDRIARRRVGYTGRSMG